MLRTAVLVVAAVALALPARAQEPTFNGRKMSEWQTMLKEDPTPRKRRAAVVALGQIALENRETLPVVLAVLGRALKNDSSPVVREQVAVVLGQQKVDEKSAGVVPDLVESLRIDRETPVRRQVTIALGRFGAYAKSAAKPLTAALGDPDPGVRAAAADALGRIGGEAGAALPELVKLLKDGEKSVRQSAIFALGRIEPEEKGTASAALVAALKTETDLDLRREAIVSLGFLGDHSPEVVRAVAAGLEDREPSLRSVTALTLGQFGPAARAAEGELLKAFRSDQDAGVRLNVVRTLCASYGGEAAKLIPVLAERLKEDPAFEVRVAIAEELGALGPGGKSAIPVLRSAQSDRQIKVREAATKAIRAIENPTGKPKS